MNKSLGANKSFKAEWLVTDWILALCLHQITTVSRSVGENRSQCFKAEWLVRIEYLHCVSTKLLQFPGQSGRIQVNEEQKQHFFVCFFFCFFCAVIESTRRRPEFVSFKSQNILITILKNITILTKLITNSIKNEGCR